MNVINKYLILLILLLSTILLRSQSVDNLKSQFESDTLGENNLSAFEERAIQKVKDYANYIEIISDKSYDNEFRNKAVDMAVSLFIDKNTQINESLINVSKDKISNVSIFFNKLLSTDYKKIKVTLTNIQFTEHLKMDQNGRYTGKIKFTESISLIDKNDKAQQSNQTDKSVYIILAKVNKEFGNNNKTSVWEVSLGKIN